MLGPDDDLFPGRSSHSLVGSEMKLRATLCTAALFLSAAPAFSQGCSMCYSTAKATSKEGQRAISKGVVVLLLPALGFMTLGVWAAFRYGKKRDLEQTAETVLIG